MKELKKKKVLVIVAHPDDETIWLGGTLIRNSLIKNNWDLTIISLCRKNDSDRAPKFKKTCEILKAKNFISDLEDDELKPLPSSEIICRIKEFIKENKNYDLIFTHGENGEYGHIRHIETHNAVKEMLGKKIIFCKKLFFFDYKKVERKNADTGFDVYVNKNADKLIKLNTFELLKKKQLIHEVYGFEKGGFEERTCRKWESFTKIKK